jgi:hypothetical protein
MQKVMGVQNGENPNFGNWGTLDLGVLGKMSFGYNPHDMSQKYYKREGGGLLQI